MKCKIQNAVAAACGMWHSASGGACVVTLRNVTIYCSWPFYRLLSISEAVALLALLYFNGKHFSIRPKSFASIDNGRPNICHSCVDFRFLCWSNPPLPSPNPLSCASCVRWTSVCSFGASIMLLAIVKRFSVISLRCHAPQLPAPNCAD